MPFFDWECSACKHVWEELVKMDGVPEKCPEQDKDKHKKKYEIKKLPSRFGTHVSWSQWRALQK